MFPTRRKVPVGTGSGYSFPQMDQNSKFAPTHIMFGFLVPAVDYCYWPARRKKEKE
jgi:hypothetical protein